MTNLPDLPDSGVSPHLAGRTPAERVALFLDTYEGHSNSGEHVMTVAGHRSAGRDVSLTVSDLRELLGEAQRG